MSLNKKSRRGLGEKCYFCYSNIKQRLWLIFFKSLFFGEAETSAEEKAARNFDVLKYDGMKALKMGKNTYAIRCFNEALKLQEDVEVLENLVHAYTREDRMEEAISVAGRLVEAEPGNVPVLLLRANLNFVTENYTEAIADCERAVTLDAADATAYFCKERPKRLPAIGWGLL